MSDQTDYAAQVMARCDELAAFSEEEAGLTRRFATPALDSAMRVVTEWMRDAGMIVRRDNIGNLIGRYEAERDQVKTLLLGSHLDTVRDAGRYDGPLGVLVALACVQRLNERGQRLPFAIEIIAFADEEGVRYHSAYLGSQVIAGRFEPRQLTMVDNEGIAMADAIRAFGGNPDALGEDRRSGENLLGYCEVHIEQGPVLESLDLPVGVVSSIAGQSRFALRFAGTPGHAGTVPMALRRDALCAAAEFVLTVEQEATATPGLVATVGQIQVAPGASNVIPGHVALSLDVRHQDDNTRLGAIEQLRRQATNLAARRGVVVDWEAVQSHQSVPCDPTLTTHLEHAVARRGIAVHRLPSGAGHDGAMLANLTPIAMLFVRCAGGISHNPNESVNEADVAVAIDVLGVMLEAIADSKGATP
jgi:allantoate deiminase